MELNANLPDFFITEIFDSLQNQRIDWGVSFVNADKAWQRSRGEGIIVAVLDTGCEEDHPDLAGQVLKQRDFTGSGVGDRNGHGTHCAGVIAAKDNEVGIIGIAPKAKLLIGKVLDNGGSGATTWIANGVRWAVENGANIISMSLGSSRSDSNLHNAIKEATQNGVIVVAAAGNSGPGTINYPGAHPEVICVGAIDASGRVANFSSTNREVDIAAPGVNILSSVPNKKWARMSGTSMATPLVAGVAALIQGAQKAENRPLFNTKEMLDALRWCSVSPTNVSNRTDSYGWGLINPVFLFDAVNDLPPKLKNNV